MKITTTFSTLLLAQASSVTVYTSKDAFDSALARFELIVKEEDFSSYLGNDTVAYLDVGENTVGSFDIDIDAESTAMTVDKGENGFGAFHGSYEKDEQKITFDDFEDGKLYAFAAKWDIEQEWADYVTDDWYSGWGSGGGGSGDGWWSKDSKDSKDDGYWDDDWWGNDWWGGGGGGSGGGSSWGDRGKLLHLKIGNNKFNLVEILHREQTDFIGFISLEGITSMTFYTPEEFDEVIDFEMSEVFVSDGKPGYDSAWGYYFSVLLQILEYFFSSDISGLFEFLAALWGFNTGDK